MKQNQRRERARKAILAGAESVFLKKGPAGASMKEIADVSGVAQSLLHHYFGSKEALWQAVQARRFEHVFEEMRPRLSRAARSGDFPREFFAAYFGFLGEAPEFVSLLGWLKAEGRPPPEFTVGKAGQIAQLIAREQQAGKVRPDLAPETILCLLWALAEGWRHGRLQYTRRLNKNADAGRWDEEYLKAALKLLAGGLKPEANAQD